MSVRVLYIVIINKRPALGWHPGLDTTTRRVRKDQVNGFFNTTEREHDKNVDSSDVPTVGLKMSVAVGMETSAFRGHQECRHIC